MPSDSTIVQACYAVAHMALDIFRRKEQVAKETQPATLPADVRYALQYRGAQLNREETFDLVRNGFEPEGLYVFLKSTEQNPEAQLSLLQQLVRTVGDEGNTNDQTVIRKFVEENAPKLPDYSVGAMKLAQFSRQGFEYWRGGFAEKAREAADRVNPTFIVAHATFIGLLPFIREHARAHKPLYVLSPFLIKDTNSPVGGYRIEHGSVEFLPKDFRREPGSIIIDDVRHTGSAERLIEAFWNAWTGDKNAPTFEHLSVAE